MHTRMEDMAPDVREKARKLRPKMCEMAVSYKSVKPEMCQRCASSCGYGMKMLDLLGMEKPAREDPHKESFVQDRRMRKIIKGMNRRWKK